jgi:septum formation protein
MSHTPKPRDLILASTSSYRKALLERLQWPFECVSPLVDETPQDGESPKALATRLAQAKAQAVSKRFPQAIVIGSDQVAELNGQALGKPMIHTVAVEQLKRMSGQAVTFHTAVCVRCEDSHFEDIEIAPVYVQFRTLSESTIESYLIKDRPYDCAGASKSESLGIALLDKLESDDPTALIGLPLIRTLKMLRAAGLDVLTLSA